MSDTPRTDKVKDMLNGLPDKDQAAYMFFHARELENDLSRANAELLRLKRRIAKLEKAGEAMFEVCDNGEMGDNWISARYGFLDGRMKTLKELS